MEVPVWIGIKCLRGLKEFVGRTRGNRERRREVRVLKYKAWVAVEALVSSGDVHVSCT